MESDKKKAIAQKYRQSDKGKATALKYSRLAKRKTAIREYRNTISGHLRHIFNDMKYRCTNPKNAGYKYYGGRGIKLKFTSDEFVNYVINELKINPIGLEIDRINNNGHYERGNIRFVTHQKNSNNRRGSVTKNY